MADLSGYTPIYVRTTGNDSTGDGSSGSPYATAQKAFEVAYDAGSGNYVIDLGVGSFGGVNLQTAEASSWPVRIAVRGVSSSDSNLGGVNANGVDQDWDFVTNEEVSASTNALDVAIISNKTANLGNIESIGGWYEEQWSTSEGRSGGSISLTDVVCGTVLSQGTPAAAYGYYGGGSGAIAVSGCATSHIQSSAGSRQDVAGAAANAGSITVTSSTCGYVRSLGGDAGDPWAAGSITLTDVVASGDVRSNGGNGNGGGGWAGSVTLVRSSCTDIKANSGDNASFDGGGPGGQVTLTDSTVTGSIETMAGMAYYFGYFRVNSGGTVTLSGSGNVPNSITCGQLVTTNLRKGRGVNGSSILGVA